MSTRTVGAMVDAASTFVDLRAEIERAGERIASSTGNQAALVTSGASAAITLAIASAITGPRPDRIDVFPSLEGIARFEVIILRAQRNGYDYAVTLTGARIVEVADSVDALVEAINERTSAILWFAGTQMPAPGIAIEEIIAVARARGVPVIVDAAAQIPPVSTLWHFTKDLGADAVIVSGGKGLRGPQAAGLLLGTVDLVDGARAHASPNQGIGRGMKVGKEELAAMTAAVEQALAIDQDGLVQGYREQVIAWQEDLSDTPGIEVFESFPSHAGEPHSILTVRLKNGMLASELARKMWSHNPPVAVMEISRTAIALNPQSVDWHEGGVVTAALLWALGSPQNSYK